MSYIGQIRKSQVEDSWGQKLTFSDPQESAGIGGKNLIITAEQLKDKGFDPSNCYFFTFYLLRKKYIQDISLRLFYDDEYSNYIQLTNIKINKKIKIDGIEEPEKISICFKPPANGYNKIAVILNNRQNDKDELQYIENKEENLIPTFYSVKNLITELNLGYGYKITNIGVQSRPDFKFVIDGEEIEVGRTGVYEMPYSDYKINFLGVINPNNNYFIIDYKCKKDTGEDI